MKNHILETPGIIASPIGIKSLASTLKLLKVLEITQAFK
jgi:hypothetical protein